MTPFEIALQIRNRPDDNETVEAYVLRTLAGEAMADFAAALEMLIGWEQADQDLVALLDCLKEGGRKDGTLPISQLIKQKRKLVYDPKLEALLARRWRCPHCKQFTSISSIRITFGAPARLLGCLTCGEPGVYPVEPKARLKAHDGGKKGIRPLPYQEGDV
jgi:hypothetical protein